METKYFWAKGTSADSLLTKADDVLKNVRIMAAGIRGIGIQLHQILSGRSLPDGYSEPVHLEEVVGDAGNCLRSLKQR